MKLKTEAETLKDTYQDWFNKVKTDSVPAGEKFTDAQITESRHLLYNHLDSWLSR